MASPSFPKQILKNLTDLILPGLCSQAESLKNTLAFWPITIIHRHPLDGPFYHHSRSRPINQIG